MVGKSEKRFSFSFHFQEIIKFLSAKMSSESFSCWLKFPKNVFKSLPLYGLHLARCGIPDSDLARFFLDFEPKGKTVLDMDKKSMS